jgi:hypothetical protein
LPREAGIDALSGRARDSTNRKEVRMYIGGGALLLILIILLIIFLL